MANPKRLQIINILREKEISAGELQRILKIPKANLSQHMAVLKQKGIVVARREGNTVYFRLARPKILKAYDIMR
ncbi:MAG: transcriptional regulator, partial [Nitrospirae bacterium RIFCSPLOWO2_02_42_7]